MDEICWMGVAQIARRIRNGELSPLEVYTAFIDRIRSYNPSLNAIVTINDRAREEAEQVTSDIARNRRRGALCGVPFTVKDCFDTAGVRTTRGSLIFSNNIPKSDATVVKRLRDAGGILLGKTNLPEFCLSVETDNRIFGRTVNPWDRDRTPGGSSGGEATAIAAGLSPLGVGSDQGGSVRLPAHYCGIVGFKPTIGRIPITGHIPDSLHQFATTGIMARYVGDVRLALAVTNGADGHDWHAQIPDLSEKSEGTVSSMRIGWIGGEYFGSLDPEVEETIKDAARSLKDSVKSVTELPQDFLPAFDCDLLSEGLYRAEGARDLAPILNGHEDLVDPRILEELSHAPANLRDYLLAAAGVERLRRALQEFFVNYDILICAVGPTVAPVCGYDHITVKGAARRLRSVNRALQPFNLCGVPAISVPYRLSSGGLPIGVQIVGRKYEEHNVLDVAECLEALRPGGRSPGIHPALLSPR